MFSVFIYTPWKRSLGALHGRNESSTGLRTFPNTDVAVPSTLLFSAKLHTLSMETALGKIRLRRGPFR